jgi:hypothetical protein
MACSTGTPRYSNARVSVVVTSLNGATNFWLTGG